jgi:hypothetical protein
MSKSKSKSHCDWQSVSQSVCLGVKPKSGTFDQRFFFQNYCLVFLGRPLWWEVGSVMYHHVLGVAWLINKHGVLWIGHWVYSILAPFAVTVYIVLLQSVVHYSTHLVLLGPLILVPLFWHSTILSQYRDFSWYFVTMISFMLHGQMILIFAHVISVPLINSDNISPGSVS